MNTQAKVREAFWGAYPQWEKSQRAKYRRPNDYPIETLMAFDKFVDMLERNGTITEALAQRVTL